MNGIKVPAFGPSDARIMVVGEAPGRDEETERKPFVGYSGQLLRKVMLGAGIDPSKVFFTNICKYRPPGNELVSWFEPKTGVPEKIVEDGLEELREEVAHVNPAVIVALGNYPLWALTGKAKWNKARNFETGKPHGYTGISDWRGSIIEGAGVATGRKVVATYHPAAVTRKWPWRVYLDLDLKRALQQSAFSEIRRPNRRLIIDPDWGTREEHKARWLADRSRILHFDIEYIGSNLLCVGFCNSSDEAVCIPTRNASDIQFCREVLESGQPLGAQNASFDCSILEYHYGIHTFEHLAHDTMLASHAAYAELPKDLGTLCSIYTEQPCYWTDISWPAIKKGLQPISDVYEYNAIDAWVTHEVEKAQVADELTDPAIRATADFERSLLLPLWNISKRGVPISKTKLAATTAEVEASVAENQLTLNYLAGSAVNVQSGPQLQAFLCDQLKMKVEKRTATGKAAFDDKTLAAMQLKAKTAQQKTALTFIRKIKKDRALKSKFLEMEFDSDGRFRHQYSPAGTVTGRLSSSKFYPTGTGGNGQNIPRDKRVRSIFVPEEGYTFFYNDLERAESLVVAHLSGDRLMLQHHAPGVNAHKELGTLLFDVVIELIDKDGEVYYMSKQTRHAGNYMQGPRTFMNNVNKKAEETGFSISLATATRLIQRYRDLHPGLGSWWDEVARELRTKGRLSNLLGRPRVFFDRLDSCLPEAVAYKPQSTVGDVLNTGLLRICADEECNDLGIQPLLQVHDAIGGQVPTRNLARAMSRMQELMQVDLVNPRTRETFVIPVELTCGPSWGECKLWQPA